MPDWPAGVTAREVTHQSGQLLADPAADCVEAQALALAAGMPPKVNDCTPDRATAAKRTGRASPPPVACACQAQATGGPAHDTRQLTPGNNGSGSCRHGTPPQPAADKCGPRRAGSHTCASDPTLLRLSVG